MQPVNQADYYARRRDEHDLFAHRARSQADAMFHADLAQRYALLAAMAQAFGRDPAGIQPPAF